MLISKKPMENCISSVFYYLKIVSKQFCLTSIIYFLLSIRDRLFVHPYN